MNRFFRYHLDHILFWVLTIGFHAYTKLHLVDKANVFQFALEIFIRNALLAGIIYFNLWIVIPRLTQGKAFPWIVASLGSLVFYTVAKGLHDAYVYGYVIGDAERTDLSHSAFYNFSIMLFYLAFATTLYLSKQWYVQREILRQVQLEKLTTELEYLKGQVNPHFLFNSINTIFFQIDRHNQEARETLGKFSDMLRYQLYECNGSHIAIEKELAYLKSYVDLQRLRRNENDMINFTIADELQGFSLPPMLLIPFIENAFKHVSSYTDRENQVRIALDRSDNTIMLSVANTTHTHTPTTAHGIGLKNVKRRLELLFPNQHVLEIQRTSGHYKVNLTLKIV